MHTFIRKTHNKAKKLNKHIVLAEGEDLRVLKAAGEICHKKIARITLLGNPKKIKELAKKNKIKIDFRKLKIENPKTSNLKNEYAERLYKLRRKKLQSRNSAKELIKNNNYFGTIMVEIGDADGMVTGATAPTGESIRPALELLRTKEEFHKVSGVFFMVLKTQLLLFADTAISVDPNYKELAHIAIDSAETAKRFGLKPKIALLSFSTKGSSKDKSTKKIQKALAMVKSKRPDLIIDGELQVDAALVPEVAKSKAPKSKVKGEANILIFPDLNSGNIAYKLVERLAKAKAIGPLLQGLKKPVNDLSRGCSYQDIINTTAFTACESEND